MGPVWKAVKGFLGLLSISAWRVDSISWKRVSKVEALEVGSVNKAGMDNIKY